MSPQLSGAHPTAIRLKSLRIELARQGLDGFLVPRADEFQGEYVPPSAERLHWISGFSGSAGLAVVLPQRAALFVDGRYTLQAVNEVDGKLFAIRHLVDDPPHIWLKQNLSAGWKIGFDPWLFTQDGVMRLTEACEKAGAQLVACKTNPLDKVWTDRPAPPCAPFVVHPLAFAGKSALQKRREMAEILSAAKADALMVTAPDCLAWLFNLRGGDVPYAPMPHGFALLFANADAAIFCNLAKIDQTMRDHLGGGVFLHDASALGEWLDRLGAKKQSVQVDPAAAAFWIVDRLRQSGAQIATAPDPCMLAKACKNKAELSGMRAAHRRDGAAMVRFLAWLETAASKGGLTEMAAASRLEAFRRENELFMDLSFPTIAGAGPNGAIVHYRVDAASNRKLQSGQLFLLDSGAQYRDGTTDVTRTVKVGARAASVEARRAFTLVLKGHIALASARFPVGTTGGQLDALARLPLWQAGLDYDHGTGHGVGSYLSVHEGPQRISKMGGGAALRPGMVLSNEPGYYKPGAFGIRIENLVAVVSLARITGGEREMLGFETLTLAPIDRSLIIPELLTKEERHWLDQYHMRVQDELLPALDDPLAIKWLKRATRRLGAKS